jgi:RHS repeat-associated protein
LQKIVDLATSTVWWQANSMNPRGQITQETAQALSSDPQIVAARTYDAVTGWLGTIQAGVGGGLTLQNQAYLYDEMGNVTERQDNNLGLTENFYFDNLYRLDHSTLGGLTNLQMGYDSMGDITSKSDVASGATWTYDPVRKHAVTQAGSSAFTYSYDGNGNVSSRNGSIIGSTSYNYPSGVSTATESATFDYGPDRQRWRMVYTGPTGNETTYYATPMFEVVHTASLTDYRHYIFVGGRAVMQLSRSVNGVAQRPLLTDHQGSISSIMHGTGTSFVDESFTPYGNRREASTWTGNPTSTELANMSSITRQGYTFQTVLATMHLNHMNGRIEDSITGRFLSPDPHVPHPGSTQSFNRYSYVENNPVSLVDPTGFSDSGHGSPCDHCIVWWGSEWGNNLNTGSAEFDAQYGGDTKSYMGAGASGIVIGTFGADDGSGASGNVSVNDSAGDTSPPASVGDSSTVDVPGVGTHPATNTVSTDANGMVTIEVGIYSPDAAPSPPPGGVNTAPVWASSAFRQYQGPMNATANIFFLEIAVFNPAFADALTAVHLSQGQVVACTACALSVAAQGMEYANLISKISGGAEVPFAEINLGPEMETPLRSGNEAFDQALSRVIWGNQPPPLPGP